MSFLLQRYLCKSGRCIFKKKILNDDVYEAKQQNVIHLKEDSAC